MKTGKCKIIKFPVIHDPRGNLAFIEGNKHIPFDFKRVYYLYDIPSGASRGGHAHKKMEVVLIALSGSFRVRVDDGFNKESVLLNRPHWGLYIPPFVWRDLTDFSSNSVAFALASTLYDEGDYIRRYGVFKKMVRDRTYK